MVNKILIISNLVLFLAVGTLGGYFILDKREKNKIAELPILPPGPIPNPNGFEYDPERVMATVKERSFKVKDIEGRIAKEKAKNPSFNKDLKEVLDAMVKEELVYQEALTLNLPESDPVLKEKLSENNFFTITNYYLTKNLGDKIILNEEKVKSFYNENSGSDKLLKPISKLRISMFEFPSEQFAMKIYKEIDPKHDIINVLKNNGILKSDFKDEDKKYFDVYPFKPFAHFSAEISNQLIGMNVGYVSLPINANGKSYLLKVEEKSTNIPLPFDIYKQEISLEYQNIEFKNIIDDELKRLTEKYKPEYL